MSLLSNYSLVYHTFVFLWLSLLLIQLFPSFLVFLYSFCFMTKFHWHHSDVNQGKALADWKYFLFLKMNHFKNNKNTLLWCLLLKFSVYPSNLWISWSYGRKILFITKKVEKVIKQHLIIEKKIDKNFKWYFLKF